ncbi:sensor histidine kinase [Nocardioides caldifontis]|uniref:sensor histidine kinase n=1 Tax=Nocardioides caldifontis TaxID=2588938 RepID=UPI0011E019D0|nr:HAMP domain-containing sensor histidine kinase [Nocardioides caldifontis]
MKKFVTHARRAPVQLGIAAFVYIAVGLVLTGDPVEGWLLLRLREPLQVLTGAILFGAGLMQLSVWRVDRAAAHIQSAGMMLALGFLAPWNVSMGRLLHSDDLNVVLSPLTAALVALTAIVLGKVLGASVSRTVRLCVGAVSSAALVLGLVLTPLLAPRLATVNFDLAPDTIVLLELAVAACWFAAAFAWVHKVRNEDPASLSLMPPLLATLGVVWVLRALAVVDVVAWPFAATLLLLTSSVVVLFAVAEEYADTTDAGRERLDSTEQALTEVAQAFATLDRERRNFAHDARNVILALQAASTTLAEHGDRLDAEVRQQLRRAIVDELGQLHQMLTSPTSHAKEEVDVAEAIRTVVATERMNGLDVQLHLEPCRARAGAQDLSRVLRNLLVNAREHAPRSPVVVRAAEHGGTVRITVEDRGPGVPAQLRRTLFERGVTTKRDDGTGLGLNVSRTLVREQGGDLRFVEGAEGGACFELTLPSARSVPPGNEPRSGRALTLLKPLPAQSRRSA